MKSILSHEAELEWQDCRQIIEGSNIRLFFAEYILIHFMGKQFKISQVHLLKDLIIVLVQVGAAFEEI